LVKPGSFGRSLFLKKERGGLFAAIFSSLKSEKKDFRGIYPERLSKGSLTRALYYDEKKSRFYWA